MFLILSRWDVDEIATQRTCTVVQNYGTCLAPVHRCKATSTCYIYQSCFVSFEKRQAPFDARRLIRPVGKPWRQCPTVHD
jgi:hypothetical protein